jgi:hypothetical protein
MLWRHGLPAPVVSQPERQAFRPAHLRRLGVGLPVVGSCRAGGPGHVDPGNGFTYLYDLAGTLRGGNRSRVLRVIGVWGLSQPPAARRDTGRMRGHPRPGRPGDDRGHLISCAAGGGYDINLVPMDAAFNRGWSAAGARFRSLERTAAARPGTLFFIRPVYQDGTDRPCQFEAGVQHDDELLTDVFINDGGHSQPMRASVLRQAAAFPVDTATVADCLDPSSASDSLFARAWRSGPASLTRAERSAVAGITGHVAESVTEILLDQLEWRPLWHFTGPGRHGIDLALLTPDGNIVAAEVKGTLVARRIPPLTRRELAQMSAEWVDKADNPGMAELDLRSTDVYGAFSVINFADMTWRIALTANFSDLCPVTHAEQLTGLNWIPGD